MNKLTSTARRLIAVGALAVAAIGAVGVVQATQDQGPDAGSAHRISKCAGCDVMQPSAWKPR